MKYTFNYTLSERRLLRFSVEKKTDVTPSGGEEHADTEKTEAGEVPEEHPRLETGIPTLDRFGNMSADEYDQLLRGGKDIDEIIPSTEAQRDVDRAFTGFMQEMEEVAEQLRGKDLKDMNFEQMFASVGRAMDKHIKPLLRKYEGRNDAFLEGIAQYAMREKVRSDKERIDQGMGHLVQSPREVFEFSREPRGKYDRALEEMLREGKTIPEIREEFEEENPEDKKGTLDAIDRLELERRRLTDKLMIGLTDESMPEGMRITLDPNTLEVQFRMSDQGIEELVGKPDSPFERAPNGDVILTVQDKKYTFVYDEKEKEYELKF